MKKDIPEKLKFVRGSKSKTEFAELLGVRHQLISDYETGRSRPTTDFYLKLISKMNINLNWLLTGKGEPYQPNKFLVKEASVPYGKIKIKTVPVVAEVGCGIPLHSWNGFGHDAVELTDVGHLHDPFIVKAKGDSMHPYIRTGDLLLCADEPQKIKDGSMVVVSFKTEPETAEANAKLIQFPDKDHVLLYSINSNYKPVLHPKKKIYKIYKLIKIIREVR